MGAYYTKEDITEYISKNTVIPFLFDAAKTKCKVAFDNPGGPTIWDHLRDDPDRYIYAAVKHGVKSPLPGEIEAGIANILARAQWNRSAPAEFALPSEKCCLIRTAAKGAFQAAMCRVCDAITVCSATVFISDTS